MRLKNTENKYSKQVEELEARIKIYSRERKDYQSTLEDYKFDLSRLLGKDDRQDACDSLRENLRETFNLIKETEQEMDA